MPELAEVETVRNTLKKKLIGKKIRDIKILYSKMIENDLNFFKENLVNQEIKDILRKGKYLIFDFDHYYLISHLRMEGKYFIKDINDKIEKHEHVIFYFDDFTLRYHDTRKFGIMCLIPKDELNDYFKNVGPDCNSEIDVNYLLDKLKSKRVPIKTALLDQSIIAGLGNIYVDEVLFKSKIHPLKNSSEINISEAQSILDNAKVILNKAILYKGTTIRSYTSSLGVYGEYQQFLCVHTKEKCGCGKNISKIKIGGRTTYYCEDCQKQN